MDLMVCESKLGPFNRSCVSVEFLYQMTGLELKFYCCQLIFPV